MLEKVYFQIRYNNFLSLVHTHYETEIPSLTCTSLHVVLNQIGMSSESKKNAHLQRRQELFFIRVWQGVKFTSLMSIFSSKKVWKYLINIQLTKSDPKRTRGVESALPHANQVLTAIMKKLAFPFYYLTCTFVLLICLT